MRNCIKERSYIIWLLLSSRKCNLVEKEREIDTPKGKVHRQNSFIFKNRFAYHEYLFNKNLMNSTHTYKRKSKGISWLVI